MPAGISLGRTLCFRISSVGLDQRMGARIEFFFCSSTFSSSSDGDGFSYSGNPSKPRHETNFFPSSSLMTEWILSLVTVCFLTNVNRECGMEKLGFFNGGFFLFLVSATYNDGSLARQMRIHMHMAVQTYFTNWR